MVFEVNLTIIQLDELAFRFGFRFFAHFFEPVSVFLIREKIFRVPVLRLAQIGVRFITFVVLLPVDPELV